MWLKHWVNLMRASYCFVATFLFVFSFCFWLINHSKHPQFHAGAGVPSDMMRHPISPRSFNPPPPLYKNQLQDCSYWPWSQAPPERPSWSAWAAEWPPARRAAAREARAESGERSEPWVKSGECTSLPVGRLMAASGYTCRCFKFHCDGMSQCEIYIQHLLRVPRARPLNLRREEPGKPLSLGRHWLLTLYTSSCWSME